MKSLSQSSGSFQSSRTLLSEQIASLAMTPLVPVIASAATQQSLLVMKSGTERTKRNTTFLRVRCELASRSVRHGTRRDNRIRTQANPRPPFAAPAAVYACLSRFHRRWRAYQNQNPQHGSLGLERLAGHAYCSGQLEYHSLHHPG